MVFPVTPLRALVKIAPGANPAGDPAGWVWRDITDNVRVDAGITLKQGRGDEASKVDPGKCSLTLDDRSGDYVRTNPLGQWYGQLAKNTPISVSILPDGVYDIVDTFTRTLSSDWGATDTFDAWTSTGSGGTVSSSDFNVASGVGTHSVPAANAYRFSYLPSIAMADVEAAVTVTLGVTASGGALEPGNLMLRVADVNNYLLYRVSVSTAQAVTVSIHNNGTGTQLGSALVSGLTHVAGTALRVRAQALGDRLRMKVWPAASTEPAAWALDLRSTTVTAAGGVGIRSGVATGNTNTKPVIFSYDLFQVTAAVQRFGGFVADWPPRWDQSGNDATVPLQASGILRRLTRKAAQKLSPLRRTIQAAEPLAYWPLEDEKGSLSGASAMTGQPAMAASSEVVFGVLNVDSSGSSDMPQLALTGRLVGEVPPMAGTAWTVQFGLMFDATLVGPDTVVASWTTPGGSYVRWDLNVIGLTNLLGVSVIAYDAAGTGTTVLSSGESEGIFIPYRVDAAQNGANIDIRLWFSDSSTPKASTTLTSKTLAAVTSVSLNPNRVNLAVDLAIGHLQVWDTATAPHIRRTGSDALASGPMLSYLLEPAHTRIERCLDEAGITATVPSLDAAFYTRMEIQPVDTLLAVLRECEDADGGVLYELPFGLGFQPRAQRYNGAVALALDRLAGHLSRPPEPTDDDQQLVNDVLIKLPRGSSARAVDQASIDASDRYDQQTELNIAEGYNDVPSIAAWRLHLGTVDELRYPSLSLDLARNPTLITDWLACGVGSRITVANPPAQVRGPTVDVLIEGWTEVLSWYEWSVEANCSPAHSWQVFEVEAAGNTGRLDTAGSQLASSATSTATSLSVATTSGPLWTTAAGDMPFDLNVAGEQVTVTAASGTSSPQTFTVTRSVNGVVKAQAAGATVGLWEPPVVAQ